MKPVIAVCLIFLFPLLIRSQTTRESSSEMYGNPYLIRDWSDGIVKFTSGRIVKDFRLRFDCVRNQLVLQFQGSTFATESKVSEFVMYPSGRKKDSLVFRKGYPPVDQATGNTFFQVLLEDSVQLLRLVSKNIIEEKELVSSNGATRGRLEEVEKYYLLKEGVLIYLSPYKDELLAALPGNKNSLPEFISEKKLRFKTPGEYMVFIKKYLELQR